MAQIIKQPAFNTDGWQNLLSGMGVKGIDGSRSTRFVAGHSMSAQELDGLYRQGGLTKRIVDIVPNEMLRRGFTVKEDTDGQLTAECERLKVKAKLKQALKWSRLYGGGLVLMGINDGGQLSQPLNENSIQSVDFLETFDRWDVQVWEWEQDPRSNRYGLPVVYTVNPVRGGMSFKVHYTRCLRFDGEDVPNRERAINEYWGGSFIESCYESLQRLGQANAGVASVIDSFVTGVLSIEGLQDLIASGQEDLVKARINLLDLSRMVMNTVLLDASEQYDKKSSSVAGLPDLLDRFMYQVSGVSAIPVTLLFGRAPSGLSNGNDQEIETFYDSVAADQGEKLAPNLRRLLTLLMKAKTGPFNGVELDDWSIKFEPLSQPTEKEQAETRKITAETDSLYLDRGVLSENEIADSRFGGNEYSAETVLKAGVSRGLEDDDDDETQAEA